MPQALITRRGGDGYATVTFDNFFSLEKSYDVQNLSVGRSNLAAVKIGGYALFAGGYYDSSTSYSTVDAYNSNLTRTTATSQV